MQYWSSDARSNMGCTSATTLTMKLLIDNKSQRVVFAEAGKDVVDFLFSLLALPMATVAKLVCGQSVAGSFGNLYGSVNKLDNTYMQTGADKNALLCPPVVLPQDADTNSPRLRLAPAIQPKVYKCTYCGCGLVTDVSGTKCPSCSHQMTTPMSYVTSKFGSGSSSYYYYGSQKVQDDAAVRPKGFVQGALTYTVQDDLTIAPMSNISSISLFNTYAVNNIGDLQEMTVLLGFNEGVEILRASLQSKTVLTDVFLRK